MNKLTMNGLIVVSALALGMASTMTLATNGFFSEGTGAKARGMGGAAIAYPQETGSIAVNPAAAVHLGNQMDIALGVFSPKPRSYTISGSDCSAAFNPAVSTTMTFPCNSSNGLSGTQESDTNFFPIPFFGYSDAIDSNSSWAVVVTALGGMNTDYATNPFDPFHPTGGSFTGLGIDLKQLQVGATYSAKVDQNLSWGVTGIVAYQVFKATGIEAFSQLSSDPANLSNNGTDSSLGFGARAGVMYDMGNGVTLGASYTSKIDMDEFSKYSGLFAEGGDLDIPSTYGVGVAWDATSDVVMALDYVRINYTDVAAISNDAQRLTSGTATDPLDSCAGLGFQLLGIPTAGNASKCLGAANGAGFGWDDMDVFKVGVAWKQSSDMTYRTGWNHGASPIKSEDATLNIIAPATVEDHLTLGFTRKLDSNSELTFDWVHTFENSVKGAIPDSFGSFTLTPGGPVPIADSAGQTEISMEQNFVEVGYTRRY